MKEPETSKPTSSRKPRADAQRNRDLLVSIAREAFAQNGAGTSLDDIAKRAGVGPGTLYRHFPSREALLEAVYAAEVEKLAEAAERFGQELPPLEALRTWLLLFVDFLNAKKAIATVLTNMMETGGAFEQNQSKVHAAVKSIYDRAIEAGYIRPDIDPRDHLRALLGVSSFVVHEDASESATRLVDILILGSRPQ